MMMTRNHLSKNGLMYWTIMELRTLSVTMETVWVMAVA